MSIRAITGTVRINVRGKDDQPAQIPVPVVGIWSANLGEAAHLSSLELKRQREGGPRIPGLITDARGIPGQHIITTDDDGFWRANEGAPGVVLEWPGVLKPGQVALSIDLLDAGDWGRLAVAAADAARCPHCGGRL